MLPKEDVLDVLTVAPCISIIRILSPTENPTEEETVNVLQAGVHGLHTGTAVTLVYVLIIPEILVCANELIITNRLKKTTRINFFIGTTHYDSYISILSKP